MSVHSQVRKYGESSYNRWIETTTAVADLVPGDNIWIPVSEHFERPPRGRVVQIAHEGLVVRVIYRSVTLLLTWGPLGELLFDDDDRISAADSRYFPEEEF